MTYLIEKVATTVNGVQYSNNLPQVDVNGGTLNLILNIVIGVVAVISVLFVVIGGLRFVLSAGNPEDASKARSTIIYAVVGLVIAIIAEILVSFVLGNSTLGGA